MKHELRPAESVATHAYCPTCKQESAIDRSRHCLWCGGETTTRKRGGWKRPDKTAYITDTQLRALHLAHVNGASIRELGRRVWQRAGYASEKSAANAISEGFKRLGLPARDRIEATVKASYKHGKGARDNKAAYKRWKRRQEGHARPCRGVKTQPPEVGRPCRRFALADSDYCRSHDPRFAEARAAELEQARARIGASP